MWHFTHSLQLCCSTSMDIKNYPKKAHLRVYVICQCECMFTVVILHSHWNVQRNYNLYLVHPCKTMWDIIVFIVNEELMLR